MYNYRDEKSVLVGGEGFRCLHSGSLIKKVPCQCRTLRFDPWVGKIPWRRKWQPTAVFLLEYPIARGATVHGSQRVRHD